MIDIENFTIKQLKELKSIINGDDKKNNIFPIGKYVIVRTYSAGVHFGILDECEGQILRLKKSRRLWRWSDAFTLSEVANNGIGKESKISEVLDEIILTQAIEIIPCSKKSIKIIEEIESYKP